LPPRLHHLLLEPVEKLARPVEVGEFEMGHLHRCAHGLLDRQRAKGVRDVGLIERVSLRTPPDAGLRVAPNLLDHLLDRRHVERERDALPGHQEVENAIPLLPELLPGANRLLHRHSAASPRSPVRIRTASSTVEINILPSPISPVRAASSMISATSSARSSGTTTSILTFGSRLTT